MAEFHITNVQGRTLKVCVDFDKRTIGIRTKGEAIDYTVHMGHNFHLGFNKKGKVVGIGLAEE